MPVVFRENQFPYGDPNNYGSVLISIFHIYFFKSGKNVIDFLKHNHLPLPYSRPGLKTDILGLERSRYIRCARYAARTKWRLY